MGQINRFNIRVYGVLIKEGHVLLAHEEAQGLQFTKFPGGGLEFGEGPADCVIREYKEETGLEVQISSHLYTTDFFQASAFKSTDQLISIYYLVSTVTPRHLIPLEERVLGPDEKIRLTWMPEEQLREEHVTFPIDKLVVNLLREQHKS